MAKAILFDMDGTLVDTIPSHNLALQQALSKLGLSISEKRLHSLLRLPTEEIYFRLHIKKKTGINFQAFNRMKRAIYYDSIRGKRLVFPGTEGLLARLGKKYKLAVVSNSSRKTAKISMPKKLAGMFDTIVTYDDVKRGKPHPEPLRKALKRLGVKASSAAFVGDSHFDVIASNELGIKCFAVTTGVSTARELRDNGAWKIMKRLPDLEKYL